LINDQHILLDEENIYGKYQDHFIKGKGKVNHNERGSFDTLILKPKFLDQKTKGRTVEPRKNQNKKTHQYCGKNGHVEKVYYKKRYDLEEKVKRLEGDVSVVH
jgi:hypothetical protein